MTRSTDKALLNREQELIRKMHALLRRIWQMDKDGRILKARGWCEKFNETDPTPKAGDPSGASREGIDSGHGQVDPCPDPRYPRGMMKPTVYLAGPIAGTKQGEAFNWRVEAEVQLRERGLDVRSPMRAKQALGEDAIGFDYRQYASRGWAYTPNGILTRDHNDCTTASAVLMNMLGARTMSFGTGMELAWCYDRHIPVVMAIEDSGNIHDGHPMFAAAVKFRVPTLEDAIDAVAVILGR